MYIFSSRPLNENESFFQIHLLAIGLVVLIEWMLDMCKNFVFVDKETIACKPR
jgi:hypothetical protein